MNIEAHKIYFIENFLKLKNDDIISQFEKLLEKVKSKKTELHQFTIDEFNLRINTSMNDSENERIIEHDELLSEIEKWT